MGIFRAQLHMCADVQFAYFAIILRENMVFCTSDKYALHKVHSFGIFRSLFKILGFHYSSVTLKKMSCNILQRKKKRYSCNYKLLCFSTFVFFQIDTHIIGILILTLFKNVKFVTKYF
jgi:hypothetical protein